ncbi:MAG: CoA transferase [Acidaminococcaceae bacterium]|nr:CoA transferase [Acidaminococcaceae bacterium]
MDVAKDALAGLRVIEVGNILAGPFCGTLLADFGADVVKVEMPKSGDLMRGMGRIKDFWFCVENRNKKNITLNLKSEKGKDILGELLKDADVLVENFRPGVFERMGFSWEVLHELNPRLVFVSSSGYGQTGPNAHKPGFDRIGLALGGLLNVTGEASGPPIKPGVSVADFMTGMFACIGTMFAIYSRDVIGTGQGQRVDCCLTESVLRIQESIIAEYCYDGTIRRRIGNGTFVTIPSGHFLTKDNEYLVLSVSGNKLFEEFCRAVGKPELLENEEYITPEGRSKNREKINKIAEEWAQSNTIDDCLKALGDSIPCCKVYTAADIMKDEHFIARKAFVKVPTEKFGVMTMQNVTPVMSGTPGIVKWAGSSIGHFNKEIYSGLLHMTDEKISELEKEGII